MCCDWVSEWTVLSNSSCQKSDPKNILVEFQRNFRETSARHGNHPHQRRKLEGKKVWWRDIEVTRLMKKSVKKMHSKTFWCPCRQRLGRCFSSWENLSRKKLLYFWQLNNTTFLHRHTPHTLYYHHHPLQNQLPQQQQLNMSRFPASGGGYYTFPSNWVVPDSQFYQSRARDPYEDALYEVARRCVCVR